MKKLRLFEMEIDSGMKFQLMCFAAMAMHITFFIAFLCFRLYLMVLFNIVSILLYAAGGIVATKKDVTPHALTWICMIFSEVLLHAVLCTLLEGVAVCFYLYPIMMVPINAYYVFIYCDKVTFQRATVIFGAVTFGVMAAVMAFVEIFGSFYDIFDMHTLTRTEINVLRYINIFYSLLILFGFSLLFYIEITGLLGKLRKSNEQLNYTATHDALTGLSNRHSLWSFFESLEKSGEHYCIVMGDLDDFKKINDTYGHNCGDIVLKSVAGIILENTNGDDMACRWGGEEILIIMRGSREECLFRLNKIKTQISALAIMSDGEHVKVTMTFGFADSGEEAAAIAARNSAEGVVRTTVRTPDHEGIDSLISMVDMRLYTGKRSGKNVIIAA